MLRHLFLLLLLLPYLGGIGAGLVGRPEAAGPTAEHPYVHSATCQHENYLRLDCFDTCNGNQAAVEAQAKHPTPAQLLASAKSIDLHCQSAEMPRLRVMRFRRYVVYQPAIAPALAAGIRLIPEQPPRRG